MVWNLQRHVVKMVLQSRAVEPETDWEEQTGEDGICKTILAVPDTAATAGDPKWRLVVEKKAVDLGGEDADPNVHGDYARIFMSDMESQSLKQQDTYRKHFAGV